MRPITTGVRHFIAGGAELCPTGGVSDVTRILERAQARRMTNCLAVSEALEKFAARDKQKAEQILTRGKLAEDPRPRART